VRKGQILNVFLASTSLPREAERLLRGLQHLAFLPAPPRLTIPTSLMHWIAPSEKDAASDALEKQLWDAADNFRANSGLTAQQYSGPILGLIFLRFAEARFAVRRTALDKSAAKGGNGHSPRRGSQVDDPTAYHAEGVLFLTPNARYDRLLSLPEGADVGKAVNDAMADVEKHNPQLAGVLPRTYQLFASTLLKELLKTLSKIPLALDYDAFGKIYEYFLGEFARTEGSKGGEFYTPVSIVRLIVEILEPFHGLILDPACGSGGMFVQSARFVSVHKKNSSAQSPTPSSPALLPAGEGSGHYRGGFDFAGLKQRAREFRQKQTPAEEVLWEILRDRQFLDLKFRRQHQFGDYLLDFYCHEKKLAVELDGEPHQAKARRAKDEKRDAYLRSQGVTSIRFENRVVFEDIEQIFTAIAKHAVLPLPVGEGRGEGAASDYSGNPSRELSIHGVEKTDETGRLCRMNLAVHGLEGNIRHGGQINSYYDDPHKATGRFDFVLANPPFNVNAVDKERLAADVGPNRRFPFGLPRTDNANYLWIQLFYSALNKNGRAGFVMANSASDARSSEQEIRKQLIEARAVDVMVAVGPNLFYTVTLPCTLWFFDKSKAGRAALPRSPKSGTSGSSSLPDRADTVLFIDARHIYRQIDRAHRDWTPAQIDFLGNLVRLYRGEELDFTLGGDEARAKIEEIFGGASSASPKSKALNSPRYRDVPGLCKAATLKEIEAQGWSLNPGRYVGVAAGEAVSDEDFKEQLETLNEELETLNAQARDLEQTIAGNVAEILEA